MSFFKQTVLIEGGMGVVALLFIYVIPIDIWTNFRCNGSQILIAGGATAVLLAGYFLLRLCPFSGLRRVDTIVRNLFQEHMSCFSLWQLAAVALLAGVGEELFFRGLIQSGLSLTPLSVSVAVLISSLLFGLGHAATPTYCLLAFLISLYLGWLFVWTDNLFVPIAVHSLYDFFVLLFVRQKREGKLGS